MPTPTFSTDKIGLACYLIVQGRQLLDVKVQSRRRSIFVFSMSPNEAAEAELEYTRSDFSRFYEAFKYLRDRTIRGSGS